MSRLFNKLEAGSSRLFNKASAGSSRLFNKMKTQVFDNPRLIHSVSNGLNQVGNYGGKISKIGAGLAYGLGQPEIGAVLSASSAASGALGHASHLLDDRVNYLERAKRKEKENNMSYL